MFDWAHYRTSKGGIKLHTLLDNETCLPTFVSITEAKEHDINAARTLSLPKGSIVAIDRGYVDFALFYRWDSEGIFFVTRPKVGMTYEVIKELVIPSSETLSHSATSKQTDETKADDEIKKTGKEMGKAEKRLLYKKSLVPCQVVKDQLIKLKSQKAHNDCPIELRLVTIIDPVKNCEMQFLTNKLDLTPRTIADIYRDRWQVELFFKCIKQNLIVKSFLGVSENAVRIQIYAALIATLLVKYLQFLPPKVDWNFSNLIHLLRINWFTYQVLYQWLEFPHCSRQPPPKDSPRIQFHKLF
jgi:IS4 transposase